MELVKISTFINTEWAVYVLESQIGRGINREGINFELAMVKTCSTWPLLNKYALKKIEAGPQTPPLPQPPMEKAKIEILNSFLQWSKCIITNLKGTLKTFNANFEGFFFLLFFLFIYLCRTLIIALTAVHKSTRVYNQV